MPENSKLCYSKYKENKILAEEIYLENSTEADQQIKKRKNCFSNLSTKPEDLKIHNFTQSKTHAATTLVD